jgi:hypothetical protein
MASGAAAAHRCPGARHAWPKVSAPTARAPARWRRSTVGVDGRSGVAPVAFRRKSRSEKWRRRQRDANAFSGIRSTADSRSTCSAKGRTILSEMIIGMQPAASVENNRLVCAESPRGQGQKTDAPYRAPISSFAFSPRQSLRWVHR